MHRRVCTTSFHVILKEIIDKNLTCPMRFFEDRGFYTVMQQEVNLLSSVIADGLPVPQSLVGVHKKPSNEAQRAASRILLRHPTQNVDGNGIAQGACETLGHHDVRLRPRTLSLDSLRMRSKSGC